MPFFTSWRSFGGLIGLLLVAKVLKGRSQTRLLITSSRFQAQALSCVFAEVIISFGLMTIVLCTSNNQRLAQWTVFAGILVATYITLEAPFSGMSMNPAHWHRLFLLKSGQQCGSTSLPILGMLLAAEVYLGE